MPTEEHADVPFADTDFLSSSAVEVLADWLDAVANPDIVIARQFRVRDLIAVLRSIENQMWSDGIDAMGEDAA